MPSKVTAPEISIAGATAVDSALLDGCRVGEPAAQRRLYELCHHLVFRLMVRMIGLQDAADGTQQAFLQVFRKIQSFAGGSKFETWLYRLAVNEALQHLRKERRRNFSILTHEPMSHQEPEAKRVERQELLEKAMARLEPELRSIFVLREIEGLSYHDISEATDIPEGTVGSRLNRARIELQQHLHDLGWES